MKTSDVQSGVFLLILAVLFCFESYRLRLGTPGVPLSGFFPFLNGIILVVLSAFYIVNSFSRKIRENQKEQVNGTSRNGGGIKTRNVPLFISAILVYTFLMEKIGFLICTILLMLFMFRLGKSRWFPSLTISLAVAFVSYFIFNKLLGANLPRGLWSF